MYFQIYNIFIYLFYFQDKGYYFIFYTIIKTNFYIYNIF